jgi:hypothetical protein
MARHAKLSIVPQQTPVLANIDLSELNKMELGTLVTLAREAAFETQQQVKELQVELTSWYLEVRLWFLRKFFEVN